MRSCSRREFQVALLAGAGCALLGCGKGATPDGTVTPTMSQVTLTFASFAKLAAVGGSALIDVSGSFPILVVRTGPMDATALSATCTHAACLVSLEGANVVHCPCHNANFALDGSVLGGPTTIPLPVYRATVGPDAIVVDLT
jgi:cytochrome b6-f complex iron-sulfur subunit